MWMSFPLENQKNMGLWKCEGQMAKIKTKCECVCVCVCVERKTRIREIIVWEYSKQNVHWTYPERKLRPDVCSSRFEMKK